MRCSSGSTIRSRGSLNFLLISRTSCGRPLPISWAKRRWLLRALGNLLDNALRFTPENGSIQISLSEHDADFEVAVSDNGCGIASEHLPRVFDRFYRAESSRGSDGAGLGLALVKSIAELHGGSAIIESNVGGGTTVKLIFPLPHK